MQLLPIVRTARVHNIPMVVHVTGLPVVAGPQDAVRESVHAVDDDVMAQCALGAQQVAQVLQVLITAEPDVTDRDITTIDNPETRREIRVIRRVEHEHAVVADPMDRGMLRDRDRGRDQPCAGREYDRVASILLDARADRGRVIRLAITDRTVRAYVHAHTLFPMEFLQCGAGGADLADPVCHRLVRRHRVHTGQALFAAHALGPTGTGENPLDQINDLLHSCSLLR